MEKNKYLCGSEWGIWDLQVQTILDARYDSLENYCNILKSDDLQKWKFFTDKVGGEENALLFDSKTYFLDGEIDKKERCTNYVRNFFTFLNVFKPEIKLIGITDHNYFDDYLLDSFIQYSEQNSCKVIVGIEINVQGIHLLVYFQDSPYEKTTFSEGIKTFLSKIDIDEPQKNSVLTVSAKSIIKDVIPEIIQQNGIYIYPHCNSNNGLFQERGKTDRTHLADIYNLKSNIMLQGVSRDNIKNTSDYIKTNNAFKSLPIFTIATDSRCLNDIGSPDENGNYQWIKSNPTFDGFRQIFYEPDERVFIGFEPELLKRVRERKTNFIKSLKIDQKSDYKEEKGIWFKKIEFPLNPGLCAIIGNRGQGKSAMADVLGLCGNSHRYKDFSFLKEERFLKDGLAENFYAELEWESNEILSINLSDSHDKNSPERVRYIPQNFFERLTNNLENYQFEKTIKDIVFSYLPEDQKLGKNSFEDLVEFKKKSIERNIEPIIRKISHLNNQIISFEKKVHPDNIKLLTNTLELKTTELKQFEKIKPKEVPNPSEDSNESSEQKVLATELNILNIRLNELSETIQNEEKENERLLLEVVELTNLIEDFSDLEKGIKSFNVQNKAILDKFNFVFNDIIKFEIHLDSIESKLEVKNEEVKHVKELLMTEDEVVNITEVDEKSRLEKISLKYKAKKTQEDIDKLTEKMSEPLKKYQKYLGELNEWEKQIKEIEGDEDKIDSKIWLEEELKYINNDLPKNLDDLRTERIELTIAIFTQKNELLKIFNQIKNEIDQEISQYKEILGEYEISIEATLKWDQKFYDRFLSYIHQGVQGSFRGKDEGKEILKLLLKEKDLRSKDSIEDLLKDLIKYLEIDQRERYSDEIRYISDQILEGDEWEQFYNYVFSLNYLEPFYELKLSNKQLAQLSPGEKGALLIVFYLLLDKDDVPLIIDQPEENLDNESIYKILTHFIKITKKKRQVIIVTHNPNLAIVGDAEQIIFVSIDKKNKNKFSYESGGIENSKINKHASDVLEGTLRAFNIRRLKYFKF